MPWRHRAWCEQCGDIWYPYVMATSRLMWTARRYLIPLCHGDIAPDVNSAAIFDTPMSWRHRAWCEQRGDIWHPYVMATSRLMWTARRYLIPLCHGDIAPDVNSAAIFDTPLSWRHRAWCEQCGDIWYPYVMATSRLMWTVRRYLIPLCHGDIAPDVNSAAIFDTPMSWRHRAWCEQCGDIWYPYVMATSRLMWTVRRYLIPLCHGDIAPDVNSAAIFDTPMSWRHRAWCEQCGDIWYPYVMATSRLMWTVRRYLIPLCNAVNYRCRLAPNINVARYFKTKKWEEK